MRKINYSGLILFWLLMFFAPSVFAQNQPDTARSNDSARLEKLISQGMDVNKADNDGNAPLMLAARWGNATRVGVLLRHGAKPDLVRSARGRTALMIACAYWAGLDVCKMLVEKGADVNVTSVDGTTPLMLAAQNGKVEVVGYLLSRGAKASLKNNDGKTALDFARLADISVFGSAGIKGIKLDKEGTIKALEKAKD